MGLRTVAASVALLIVGATSSCGGESPQPAAAEKADFAYRVSISGERDSVEWVAPGPGWWRRDGRDAGGCMFALIRAEDRYSTKTSCNPPVVRIGSPEFLGFIDADAIALPALLRRSEIAVGDEIHLKRGDTAYVLTIVERIPLAEARARGLFTVSTEGAGLIERELEPGEPPTTALRAYWFGPRIGARTAITAVKRDYVESDGSRSLYQTYYELPSAHGKTSARIIKEAPEGELKVVNVPRTSPDVADALEHYRRGPSRKLTLANGETATLFTRIGTRPGDAFAVATRTTLVYVGPVPRNQIVRFAVRLRPL